MFIGFIFLLSILEGSLYTIKIFISVDLNSHAHQMHVHNISVSQLNMFNIVKLSYQTYVGIYGMASDSGKNLLLVSCFSVTLTVKILVQITVIFNFIKKHLLILSINNYLVPLIYNTLMPAFFPILETLLKHGFLYCQQLLFRFFFLPYQS